MILALTSAKDARLTKFYCKMVNGFRYYRALAAGHSGQFTPMRLPVNTVIHTTLVGLEPATVRSLVRRATM